MVSQVAIKKNKGTISNSTLIIIGFATAFFPRLLVSFKAPSIINFFHFGVIPGIFLIAILTTRTRDRKAIRVVFELLLGMFIFLTCMIASALLNGAGLVNIFLQFMFQAEPFMLLAAIISIPFSGERLRKFRYWLLGFALFNLFLAIIQSILMPIGIYPKPQGGTLEDNITGVFGGGGGSAANYISCSVSFYFSLYFFNHFQHLSLWTRIMPFLGAVYQIQVSDSKQVLLGLVVGWGLLAATKVEKPVRLLGYITVGFIAILSLSWALSNLESEFLEPYQNWTNRPIWGWDGLAAQTKFAAFRIVPSYFKTPLDWLLGLGPGHTATRLGAWVLKDYKALLMPLGATIHPATQEFWNVIESTYLPKESTIFFPMFTWVGIWADVGIVGLSSYLYLCSIVWRRICVDNFCKFLLLSTAALGFIITQMEEPGQMLTISCFLGLRWHEEREARNSLHDDLSSPPLLSAHSQHW